MPPRHAVNSDLVSPREFCSAPTFTTVGTHRQIGEILPVTIYDTCALTLFGTVLTEEVGPEVYRLG